MLPSSGRARRASVLAAMAAMAVGVAASATACSVIGEGPACSGPDCDDAGCVGPSCTPDPECSGDDCPPGCEGSDCEGPCGPEACGADACGEIADGCGGTVLCSDGCALEGTWYVGGPNASDDNPGTAAEPFATIQRAAEIVAAGEVVRIRSGVYRETVVPESSGTAEQPIVFQPDGEAQVTISGADAVTGPWSVYQGSIHETTLALPNAGYRDDIEDNGTLLANQLFVDGGMMVEARWPNIPDTSDLLDRDHFRDGDAAGWNGGGDTTLVDSGIPDIPGGWSGGVLWANGWFISQTKVITAHGAGQLQFPGTIPVEFRHFYYLTGRLGALDAEREWFYDGAKLYFWAPGGAAPSGVEVKARNWALDVRGRSFVTLRGVALFASSVISDAASEGLVLDGIDARYIAHSVTLTDSDLIYTHTDETGIRLLGPGSVIRNSVVDTSSDQGIVLGSGATARNNLVRNIGYGGTYASAISAVEGSVGAKILHNTMQRVGRAAIDLRTTQDLEIGFNDISEFALLNIDTGGIYGARSVNLTGTRIHHNWIHDSKAQLREGIETGIYFDQAAGPCTVDHNVLWNNLIADLYNQLANGDVTNGPSLIYNNTFATHGGDRHSYVTYVHVPADVQRNNIYRDDIVLDWGKAPGDVASSLLEGTDPLFVGSGAGGLAFRIADGSPAANAGIELPGITDGFMGSAPDMGAYELGGEAWTAGQGSDPQQ